MKSFEIISNKKIKTESLDNKYTIYEENLLIFLKEIKTIKRKAQNAIINLKENSDNRLDVVDCILEETKENVQYFYQFSMEILNKLSNDSKKSGKKENLDGKEEEKNFFIELEENKSEFENTNEYDIKQKKTLKIYQYENNEYLHEELFQQRNSSCLKKPKKKNDSNLMNELNDFLNKNPKSLEEEIIDFSEKNKMKENTVKNRFEFQGNQPRFGFNIVEIKNKNINQSQCLQESN